MGLKVFGVDLTPKFLIDPISSLTQQAFKSLGLIPDIPDVPSMPSPPSTADAAKAAEEARLARKKRYGRQQTILTSPLGAPDEAGAVQRKSLLGA